MSYQSEYQFYVITATGDDFAASELEDLGFDNLISCLEANLLKKVELSSTHANFSYELYQYDKEENDAFRSGFSYYTDNLDHDMSKTKLSAIVELYQLSQNSLSLKRWLVSHIDKFAPDAINWDQLIPCQDVMNVEDHAMKYYPMMIGGDHTSQDEPDMSDMKNCQLSSLEPDQKEIDDYLTSIILDKGKRYLIDFGYNLYPELQQIVALNAKRFDFDLIYVNPNF